jgi:hypothetical protein
MNNNNNNMSNVLKGIQNTNPELSKSGIVTCGNLMPYDIFNFTKDNVDYDFMINSISKLNRYIGHNKHENGYTVAQHSVMMAKAALLVYGDTVLAKQCLVHDLPEAYTGDIMKPLKNAIGSVFDSIEQNIEKCVFEALEIQYPLDIRVKEIDKNIAQFEMSIICHDYKSVYNLVDIWTSQKSKDEFYNMDKIINKMHKYNKKEIV